MDVFLQNRISVRNLDAYSGLGVSFHFIDVSHVEATINGKASSHRSPEDEDINKLLKFDFSSSLFTDDSIVIDLSSGVVVDFINKANLVMFKNLPFKEDPITNQGSIIHTNGDVIIRIDNSFLFTNSINKVNANISAINLPRGLDVVFSFVPGGFSQLEVQLTGKAIDHTDIYNVDNLQFEFKSDAFKDSIAAKSPNMKVEFINNTMIKAVNHFVESVNNDGTIANRVTVKIDDGATFKTALTGAILKNNLTLGPTGNLSPSYRIISPKELEIELKGEAASNARAAINSTTLLLEFNNINTLFDGAINPTNVPIELIFVDSPIIEIVADDVNLGRFKESFDNDGSIANNVTLRVSGDTINTDFIGKIQGLITPINLSPDYKASFVIRNASTIIVSLSGEAVVHKKSDSSNDLKFTFDGALFESGVDVTNMEEGVFIDFIDGTNTTTQGIFKENGLNIGEIDIQDKVTITLLDNAFKGEIIDGTFVLDNNIDIRTYTRLSNIPNGLRYTLNVIGDRKLIVSLQGTALSHDKADSINNISLEFINKDMFTKGISPKEVKNIQLEYIEYADSYVEGKFIESANNDGSIGKNNKITISLEGDRYVNVDNISDMITASNVPKGLVPVYKISPTRRNLIISLEGQAKYHSEINSKTIKFSFTDTSLFRRGVVIKDIEAKVNFIDSSGATASGIFMESNTNEGRFDGSEVLITLQGDRFEGNVDVNITPLPAGLTVETSLIKGNLLRLELKGQVTDVTQRDIANNLNNLVITFPNATNFRSRRVPPPITGIRLEFIVAPAIAARGELVEISEDNGKVGGSLLLDLSGGFFNTNVRLSNAINISYSGRELDGLEVKAKLNNEKQLEFSFIGAGINHTEREVEFDIKFDPSLFVDGVSTEPIRSKVKFIKRGIITLENKLKENISNDGSINKNITINIDEGKFSNVTNINNFINIENLPIGLNANFSFININKLEVSFLGNAISHNVDNSIDNIKISLDKEVIRNEIGLEIDDIKLEFVDAPSLIYETKFFESKLDDGSITNGINVTVISDSIKNGFNPVNYMSVTYTDKDGNKINKLPDGLNFEARVISNTKFILFLRGNATDNNVTDNINDLEITMKGDFLKKGIAPSVMKNMEIIFSDTPSSKIKPITGFTEALRDIGSIGNKVTIDMEGDEFNPNVNIGSFINVSNLPTGLSLKSELDKKDPTKLILELTGNARNHSEEDTTSIHLEFLEGLFKNRVPIAVVNIPIIFNTSNIVSTKNEFVESSFNNGTIREPITLNITGSTLRRINPNAFITASNIPEGLRVIFNVIDSSTITMSLAGKAKKHGEQDSTTNDNISPISLSFKADMFVNDIAAKPLDIIHVRFIDPPVVKVAGTFMEDYTNDGSIDTAITFTIVNDLFNIDQDIGQFITTTDLPKGLSVKYKAITGNRIIAYLTGQAKKHKKEDNTDVSFTFEPDLFVNKLVSNDIDKVPILFDNIRPAILEVDGDLVEDIQNDGTIATSIIVNILDDTLDDYYKFPFSMLIEDIKELTGEVGDENGKSSFTLDGVVFNDIVIEEDLVPLEDIEIITSLVEKINNEGAGTNGLYAEVTVDRKGLPHLNILKHKENRRVSVTGSTGNVIILTNHYNFEDPGYAKEQIQLGLDPTNPTSANNRAITRRQTKLEYMLDRLMFDENLPDGLKSRFTFLSNKKILVEIDGSAYKHATEDSIDNYTISFSKKAFKKKLAPVKLDNIPITFKNPQIKYEGIFQESDLNNGSIKGALTLFLTGDEFKDDIDPQLLNGLFAIDNLPEGLAGNFIIEAKNIIRFELIGKAKDHNVENNINDLAISFSKKLFKNGVSAEKLEFIKIGFIDTAEEIDGSGGSGSKGSYITFISPRGNNLSISAGGANFGLEGSEHQSTLNLIDVFNKQFSENDLYAIGDEIHPSLTQLNGGYGVGVTSKQSSMVFLETVDAAIDQLNQARQQISSFYQRIQQAGEVLSVEKINLKSANSRLVNIDFAEESAQFNRADILSEASNFALIQSNSLQRQKINFLLDGIK
jgi:flagellin-like hook-associated protein FlgL